MIWALHGNLGLPSDWRSVVRAAASALPEGEWRPLDLRRLDAGAADSLDEAAAAVCAEVEAAGDESPILLGYSMGGRIALHCLLREESVRWTGAVIVSAHTGLADDAARERRRETDATWRRLADSLDPDAFLSRWNAQPVLAGAGGSAGGGVDLGEASARIAGAERFFGGWSLGRQRDLLPRLPNVACPVAWISGESDVAYAAIGRSAAAVLPRGRLVLARGVGHRVPWDAPQIVAREILALATGSDSLS